MLYLRGYARLVKVRPYGRTIVFYMHTRIMYHTNKKFTNIFIKFKGM